ncbi:ADP-glucose pyrophosphorylase small subunit ADPGp-2 [Gossypium australe]|uniref:ADP-glucose pyrophosphorylase small subunit ADPGp-2 n=1 Tax=Gossypium australe TaxID=47621 RepID=A0A5B6ULD0_9ROSI|nr:ADP-glucose pyrophosphorylase small subunit ADPGp-2 [Gossypium australe]
MPPLLQAPTECINQLVEREMKRPGNPGPLANCFELSVILNDITHNILQSLSDENLKPDSGFRFFLMIKMHYKKLLLHHPNAIKLTVGVFHRETKSSHFFSMVSSR